MIIVTKGGAGSGNWGHAGRQGKVGGSSPREGVGAAMSIRTGRTASKRQAIAKDIVRYTFPELILEAPRNAAFNRIHFESEAVDKLNSYIQNNWFKNSKVKPTAQEFIAGSYLMKDEVSGFHTKVRNVTDMYSGVKIVGQVMDKNGHEVGTFTRSILNDTEVHNDYFKMDDAHQGSGFGNKFYQHAENAYVVAGIEKVTIFANITVGGYAWARMGFDFEREGERADAVSTARRIIENNYPDVDAEAMVPDGSKAWDIAALVGPDGERIGKQAMLGSDWYAIKLLKPGSESLKVAREYYDAKAKGKPAKTIKLDAMPKPKQDATAVPDFIDGYMPNLQEGDEYFHLMSPVTPDNVSTDLNAWRQATYNFASSYSADTQERIARNVQAYVLDMRQRNTASNPQTEGFIPDLPVATDEDLFRRTFPGESPQDPASLSAWDQGDIRLMVNGAYSDLSAPAQQSITSRLYDYIRQFSDATESEQLHNVTRHFAAARPSGVSVNSIPGFFTNTMTRVFGSYNTAPHNFRDFTVDDFRSNIQQIYGEEYTPPEQEWLARRFWDYVHPS